MTEALRMIESVSAAQPNSLRLRWSGGDTAQVDVSNLLRLRAFKSLKNADTFSKARIGEWGHSVVWPDGTEVGADRLWLETLTALGKQRTRAFLEWRARNGLSLSKAATALGMSRRMIAYYSGGERDIPLHVLLACFGWEHWPDRTAESEAERTGDLIAELTN